MNKKAEISTAVAVILLVIVIISASAGSYFVIRDDSIKEFGIYLEDETTITRCFGILTTSNKTETIKLLTEQNDNKSIYPLVLELFEGCPYPWIKTYYSDEDFPNESVCFKGSCLIKYESDALEVNDA